MNDLISREAAIHAVDGIKAVRNESWYSFYQKVLRRLNILPPAEPEQRTAYWEPVENGAAYGLVVKCSRCGTEVIINDALEHLYCSECGAKMEVEKHE